MLACSSFVNALEQNLFFLFVVEVAIAPSRVHLYAYRVGVQFIILSHAMPYG